jgi:hypothetical protein
MGSPDLARGLATNDDVASCCLRQWLARVPDHRSPLGPRHPSEYLLALAICAFTAAGHDSPSAIAEWAVGCARDTLAVPGRAAGSVRGGARAPSARTFARVFADLDAGAFNAALYGNLATLPAGPAGALLAVTRHEREQRRAARAA